MIIRLKNHLGLICLGLILLSPLEILAQNPVLKHSYTFNDSQVTDVVSGADGKANGGTFENGMFIASEQGDHIELPADDIKINTFKGFTLEAYIVTGTENLEFTMLSYFGNTSGSNGTDYIFQSVANRGQSRFAISAKENRTPWSTENLIFCKQLNDGKPHHVVSTFDDKELKMYIDGFLVGTQSNEDHPENRISNLGTQLAYLAKSGYANDATWTGKIDEFNIYEGVLDGNEVLKKAEAYIPNLDLSVVEKNLEFTDLIVDQSGKFDKPITGKAVVFAEIMPKDKDGDRWVDQMLVFSDGAVRNWEDYSTMIRTSIYSGYLDVANGSSEIFNKETKIPVDIDYVYQCWIALDVSGNTYSVYAKMLDMDEPVVIYENASFTKEVTSLTQWNLIHNRRNDDALKMNTLELVDQVGDLPPGYVPTKDQVFTIAEAEIAAGSNVLENPSVGMKRGRMELRKLVLTDSTTEMYFHTPYRPRYWVSIPQETFIKGVGSDEKLYIKRAEGIKIGARHHTPSCGYSEYKLVFPALKKGTEKFDYGVANEGGNWFIYDIQLKPSEKGPLAGNWFNTSTGDWEFSVFEDAAVYDSKVWDYEQPISNEKKGTIRLKSGNESLTLFYKIRKGDLMIGKSKKNLITLSLDANYTNVSNPPNPQKFEVPIFKMDTAIFSGYVKGFSPRFGQRTATVYVDNVLTGEQESHLLELNDKGIFRMKIPMTYPQSVFTRTNFGILSSPFLEPGEETFIMIDPAEHGKNLVMGKNARLIADDQTYDKSFNRRSIYNEYGENILGWEPEEFKEFCLQKQAEDLKILEELKDKVSDRYYQVMQKEITYSYMRDILHYGYTLDGARRQANQNVTERTEMPSEPEFYDFLTNDLVNDELALLANSFENFMNAFMYSRAIRPESFRYSVFDLAKDAKGLSDLSEEQKKLLEDFDNATVGVAVLDEAFSKIYGDIQGKTIQKYNEQFKELLKDTTTNEHPILKLAKFLNEAETLTDEESRYVTAAISHYSKENVQSFFTFMKDHQEDMNQIFQAASKLRQTAMLDKQINLMKENLAIEPGLASDIMSSQQYLRKVVSEMTPLSDDNFAMIQSQFNYPFISSYVEKANLATIAKIEANKSKGGYVLNEAPKTEADKVFDEIVSKYKGKVIYVDFWATWCGPCRSSMRRQKPMKEELEGQDIVFVYITNPSSPETTYNNMIPNIKGEHYRLSQDQWNYLSDKFNISGIPHYAIVNKRGEVVDPDASRDPSVLKKTFARLMEEE